MTEPTHDTAAVSAEPAAAGRGSTAAGVVWNVLQYGGGKFVALVSTMVLARLLGPESFGLMALAMLAVNIFDRFKDLGVGQALVQSQRPWREVARTGFGLTVGTALLCALLAIGFAEPIAAVLSGGRQTADLTPMIRALGAALFVSGLSVFPDSFLRRRMHFRDRTAPELVGAVIKAAVSIGLALGGLGAWSLVWGQVAATVTTTGWYWWAYRRRSGHADLAPATRPAASELTRYGASLSLVALLALVLENLDYLVIGNRLGATELGYYTMAYRMPEMLVLGICVVIGQVLFSSFSRQAGDIPALGQSYLRATRIVALTTVPVAVGMAAAAGPVVRVLFGDQYLESVQPLVALALMSGLYSLSFHAGEVYKATGRTRIMIVLALGRLAVAAPLLWWAAGYGIVHVAIALLAVNGAFTVVRLALIRQVLRLRLSEQLGAIVPVLLCGALMFAAVWGVVTLTPGWAPLARLALGAAVGLVVYVAALLVLERRGIEDIRSIVAGRRSGQA